MTHHSWRTWTCFGAAFVLAVGTTSFAEAAGAATHHHKPVAHIRTVVYHYTAGCGVGAAGVLVVETDLCANVTGWFPIARRKREHYISAAISDDHSLEPVRGDFIGGAANQFCGGWKGAVNPSWNYLVLAEVWGNTDCPGVATTGTVTIKYSNLPLK